MDAAARAPVAGTWWHDYLRTYVVACGVAGALAAGLQPVHMDPYGFCPSPAGHPHLRRLADLPALIGA